MDDRTPEYYKGTSGDVIDEWRERYGDEVAIYSCLANIDKYLARRGKKPGNPAYMDLGKARTYLSRVLTIWAESEIEAYSAPKLANHIIAHFIEYQFAIENTTEGGEVAEQQVD